MASGIVILKRFLKLKRWSGKNLGRPVCWANWQFYVSSYQPGRRKGNYNLDKNKYLLSPGWQIKKAVLFLLRNYCALTTTVPEIFSLIPPSVTEILAKEAVILFPETLMFTVSPVAPIE